MNTAILIVTYNSANYIANCLKKIKNTVSVNTTIVVVDNASSDETVAIVRRASVKVIQLKENIGFGGGVNAGLNNLFVDHEIVVVVNPDVYVEPNWLEPLVGMFEHSNVGLVQPRIILTETQKINALGLDITWFGLSYPIGLDESKNWPHTKPLAAVSGACFAIGRQLYKKIGGLDESLFMYVEDAEYSWRARLAGFDVVRSDDSVVCHHYSFDYAFSSQKIFNLEFGRLWMILTLPSIRTIVLLLPLWLFVEIVLLFRFYRLNRLELYRQLWQKRETLFAKRQKIKSIRQLSDQAIFARHNRIISFGPLRTYPVKIFNAISGIYCNFVSPWL